MNLRDDIKLSLKILKLCFFIFLYVHIIACVWYFIIKQTQNWVPPLDFMWYQVYQRYGGNRRYEQSIPLYDSTLFHKYWVSMYHSVLMLTGNQVGPRTTFESAFTTIAILLGAIINANIFGNMALLITNLERKSTRFQEKIDIVNTVMKNMKMPQGIQRKVQNYIVYTQSTLDHKRQLQAFLQMLSPSLKNDVLIYLFSDIVKKNPILKSESQLFKDNIVKMLETFWYLPEDKIIQQGETGSYIYFLVKGQCLITVRDHHQEEKFVKLIQIGSMFGEVALIANCKRTASVKGLNYIALAGLASHNFQTLCDQFPQALNKIRQQFIHYHDPWKTFIKSVMRGVHYFSRIPNQILDDMSYMLSDQYFQEGEQIVKSKDICQSIIFLTRGEVEVSIKDEKQNKLIVIDVLKQGANFGAYWSLSSEEYEYTVTAKNQTVIQVFPISALIQLRNQYFELDNDIIMAEQEIEKCDQAGGIIWDISHRRSRVTKRQNPLNKFRRAIKRLIKITRIKNSNHGAGFQRLVQLAKKQQEEQIQKQQMKRVNKSIQQFQIKKATQKGLMFGRRGSKFFTRRGSSIKDMMQQSTIDYGESKLFLKDIMSLKEEMGIQRKEISEVKELLQQLVQKSKEKEDNDTIISERSQVAELQNSNYLKIKLSQNPSERSIISKISKSPSVPHQTLSPEKDKHQNLAPKKRGWFGIEQCDQVTKQDTDNQNILNLDIIQRINSQNQNASNDHQSKGGGLKRLKTHQQKFSNKNRLTPKSSTSSPPLYRNTIKKEHVHATPAFSRKQQSKQSESSYKMNDNSIAESINCQIKVSEVQQEIIPRQRSKSRYAQNDKPYFEDIEKQGVQKKNSSNSKKVFLHRRTNSQLNQREDLNPQQQLPGIIRQSKNVEENGKNGKFIQLIQLQSNQPSTPSDLQNTSKNIKSSSSVSFISQKNNNEGGQNSRLLLKKKVNASKQDQDDAQVNFQDIKSNQPQRSVQDDPKLSKRLSRNKQFCPITKKKWN